MTPPYIAGAEMLPGEPERIKAALAALEQDPHAPREISVRFVLTIHHEYPKHVGPYVVNSKEEEKEARAKVAAEEKKAAHEKKAESKEEKAAS